MKRLAIVALFSGSMLIAADLTKIAAGTTIAVNVLEIRSTTSKLIKVWKAARKTTVKAAKKVAGRSAPSPPAIPRSIRSRN